MRTAPGHYSGFTLLELIIVLALIIILSVAVVPYVASMITDQREINTRFTEKTIAEAISAYYKISYDTSLKPLKPLEQTIDPIQYLVAHNFLNFIPKDSCDRDFRVEINTTKAGSRSGVNGETAVDVYIGEYYLTIRSGGPD
ncbi:MAG: prepilin-type N-terminal cleavage/methylation domain-containing protein, partial [Candidatus Wallbacteria bacterium]|nr:prepilin-type N-terminal cleavage/methylation domain-containing protein [Candidatus Wallbacteria bacterium]